MFALGDRDIFVSVNNFEGKVKIHIRQYFKPNGDQWVPTKKGITLNKDEWLLLKSYFTDIDRAIDHVEQEQQQQPQRQQQPPAGSRSDPPATPFRGFRTARQYCAELQQRDH